LRAKPQYRREGGSAATDRTMTDPFHAARCEHTICPTGPPLEPRCASHILSFKATWGLGIYRSHANDAHANHRVSSDICALCVRPQIRTALVARTKQCSQSMEASWEESKKEINIVEMRPDEVRCNLKAHQSDIDRDAAFQGLLADPKRLCDSFSTLCGLAGSRIVKFVELARSLEIQEEQLRWHHVYFHTRVQSRRRAMSLLELTFASLRMLLVLASVASSCVKRKFRLPLAST